MRPARTRRWWNPRRGPHLRPFKDTSAPSTRDLRERPRHVHELLAPWRAFWLATRSASQDNHRSASLWPKFGSLRAKLGRSRAEVGRDWANVGRVFGRLCGPKMVENRAQVWAELGRNRAQVCRSQTHNLAENGCSAQRRSKLGKMWPMPERVWSTSPQIWPSLAFKFVRPRPVSAPFRPTSTRIRPSLSDADRLRHDLRPDIGVQPKTLARPSAKNGYGPT